MYLLYWLSLIEKSVEHIDLYLLSCKRAPFEIKKLKSKFEGVSVSCAKWEWLAKKEASWWNPPYWWVLGMELISNARRCPNSNAGKCSNSHCENWFLNIVFLLYRSPFDVFIAIEDFSITLKLAEHIYQLLCFISVLIARMWRLSFLSSKSILVATNRHSSLDSKSISYIIPCSTFFLLLSLCW